MWKIACSRVLRRNVINLTGPVELLLQQPFRSKQERLRECDSALYSCCICWGYKNTADPESSKSSCSSRCSARMRLLCKILEERQKKRTKYHSVPRPGFGVPTLKKNGRVRLPTRHKGHNIFSTLSLCIFYSAPCLLASSSLQPHPSAEYCHIMPQYKMLVCRFTNML